MPATIPDIAAGTRDSITALWVNPAIGERYSSARDGSAPPAEGFFDRAADAEAVAAARGQLLGVERRRLAVVADDVIMIDLAAGLPCARVQDPDSGVDGVTMIARIELDLDAETTFFELIG